MPLSPFEGRNQMTTASEKLAESVNEFVTSAGVPATEFDMNFPVKMAAAMMVSFHKYGRVAQAYPGKFDAIADIRARLRKYVETGDKQYLVDVANFAMIEAMHPRHENAHWGVNDEQSSIGRSAGRILSKEDNQGNDLRGGVVFQHPVSGEPL
jgi:hypothetical protein